VRHRWGGESRPEEWPGRSPPEERPGLRSLLSTRSFGLVLLGLVLSYTLAVARTAREGASLVLIVQMATVLIALRASRAHRIVSGVAGAVMVLAAIAAVANLFGAAHDPAAGVFVAGAALYLVTPIAIVRSIVRAGRVDRQVVLAVIDSYLMIGMFFAFSYRAMGVAIAGPFFGMAGEGTTAQTLFFSFTTLTTTGYGNLIPVPKLGQSFAVTEMLVGQLFLVTALAKIISEWRPRRWGSGGRLGEAPVAQPPPAEADPPPPAEPPVGEPPPTVPRDEPAAGGGSPDPSAPDEPRG